MHATLILSPSISADMQESLFTLRSAYCLLEQGIKRVRFISPLIWTYTVKTLVVAMYYHHIKICSGGKHTGDSRPPRWWLYTTVEQRCSGMVWVVVINHQPWGMSITPLVYICCTRRWTTNRWESELYPGSVVQRKTTKQPYRVPELKRFAHRSAALASTR